MEKEKELTEQESLTLINEMIDRAQNNFRKGSGNSMIFWGCAVSITSVIVFILLNALNNPYQAFHAWWLMVPAVVIDIFLRKKRQPETYVKTRIDSIISMIWFGYLLFIVLFLAIVFAFEIVMRDWHVYALITPIILLAVGMAEFVTAKACQFKFYFYGAIIMWVGAVACLTLTLITQSISYQFIVLAFCMIFGFVIAGILQNKKAEEKCSKN